MKPTLGFLVVVLLFLVSVFSSIAESKCSKGCSLALASYHVWKDSNLTFIAEVLQSDAEVIVSYNKQTIPNKDSIREGIRANVPFHVTVSAASFWVMSLITQLMKGTHIRRWLKITMQIWPRISFCNRLIANIPPIIYLLVPRWKSPSIVRAGIAWFRTVTVCLLRTRFGQRTPLNRLPTLRDLMWHGWRVTTQEWISTKGVAWCISQAKVRGKFIMLWLHDFFFFFF